jgi:signal transduction histidine kinase/phage shock protein PspC (stress-responsive transcriptional regulator)
VDDAGGALDGGRLERSPSERVIAGVSGGLAAALGIDVVLVRLAFLIAMAIGGLGIAVYVVAAAGMPLGEGPAAPRRQRAPMAIGALVVVGCLAGLLDAADMMLPDSVLVPLTLLGAGAALIWRRAGGEVRVGLDDNLLRGGARTLAGVLLVAAGLGLAIGQSGGIGPVVAAALAAGTVAAGIGLLVAPRLRRVRAEADAERRERIRIEERERVAARLHDSVLQTLALIQRAPDGDRARRLARRQDRELRAWLYGGEDPGAPTTLAGALRAVVDETEDAYDVSVGLVQPADLPLDPALEALVDATREAVTNAAKHAGVDRINVLVRVSPQQVSVFVDDRGVGFDPASVPSDRHGLRDSMRARLVRVGGSVSIETAPGAGTDIELLVPRDSRV